MMNVKEVLRRWQAGHRHRDIARAVGIDRKTVGRYVKAAMDLGASPTTALSEEIVAQVTGRVQARPEVKRSAPWNAVAAHRDRLEKWLTQPEPLTLRKVHTLLRRDHGVEASYAVVRHFAIEELGWGKKPSTVRIDDPPAGQEAQIDFGKMGRLWDAETARMRTLWALVITLVYSRYMFVFPTFVQTTAAICEGLDQAWKFFGGMVCVLIADNPKSMIHTPGALHFVTAPEFLEYLQARGLFVDPARVGTPKDKARVENQIPYVRENWFAGESFVDLEDARRAAERWCVEVAGRRVHGTTRKVPREQFDTMEKGALQPPPTEPFDVPTWIDRAKVHCDQHVRVDNALYSVPSVYRNKTVRARLDRTTVKLYFGLDLIVVHPRQPPGGRSTEPTHYPPEKIGYATRNVETLIARARERGTHVGRFVEKLLAGPLPWTRMRQGYALVRLCDKYGDGRVEAVCQSALAFDVLDVTRIARMVESAAKPTTPPTAGAKIVALAPPRFARSREHFATYLTTWTKGGA